MSAAAKRAAEKPLNDPWERIGDHNAVAVNSKKWGVHFNHTRPR
jgi:hypothetical protein